MNRHVALVIVLGLVAIFSLIAMSPWIVVGPKRLLKGQWQRLHKTQAEKA
jgi:hypothetical protein